MTLDHGAIDKWMYEHAPDVKAGSVRPALVNQDPEFIAWLMGQIPQGGTIAELLVAMALDTYEQEKADET